MMRSSSFLKPQKLSACCADDCGLPELGGRLADQRDKCVHGAHGVCVCLVGGVRVNQKGEMCAR